ncbi:hypothetical protein ACP6JB_004887 [Aspergillus fumigatus]
MSIDSRVSTGETGCADAWRVVDFEKPKLPENLQPLISDKFGLSDLLTELGRRDSPHSAIMYATRKLILDPRTTDLSIVTSTNLGTASSPYIVVQLPEDDRKLLLTGRPWQFLEPGPDENDLAKEIDSIEITVAELSAVSERVTKAAREIDTLKEELLRRQNRLVLLHSQQYSLSDPEKF